MILGPDIFISYARADATRYALALANALFQKSYAPYVDQLRTVPDLKPPRTVRRALDRSRMLVVIASEGSQNSIGISYEVGRFPKRPNRPIVIVDIGGARAGAAWAKGVVGLPAERDTRDNLASAKPDQAVLDRITSAFTYTRRAVWFLRLTIVVFSFVAILLAAAAYLGRDVRKLGAEQHELEKTNSGLTKARDAALQQNQALGVEQQTLKDRIVATQSQLEESTAAAVNAMRDAEWQMRLARVARELSRSPTSGLDMLRPLLRERPDDPRLLSMLFTLADGDGALYSLEERIGSPIDYIAASPSGRRVAAVGWLPGSVAVLDLDDGSTRAIEIPGSIMTRSGDGGPLTFLDERRLWISGPQALLLDTRTRVTRSFADRFAESWAADGADFVLARTSGTPELVVFRPLTDSLTRLSGTPGGGKIWSAWWSPDTREVAIARQDGVEVLSIDRPAEPPVVITGADVCSFSTDDRFLACSGRTGVAVLDRNARTRGFQKPTALSEIESAGAVAFGSGDPEVLSVRSDNVTKYYKMSTSSAGDIGASALAFMAEKAIARAFPVDVKLGGRRVDVVDNRSESTVRIADLPRSARRSLVLPGGEGLAIGDESGVVRIYGITRSGPITLDKEDLDVVAWARGAAWKFGPNSVERLAGSTTRLDTGFTRLIGATSTGQVVYVDARDEIRWIETSSNTLAPSRHITAGAYDVLAPHILLANTKGSCTLIDFASGTIRPVQVPHGLRSLSPGGNAFLSSWAKTEVLDGPTFNVDAFHAEWWSLDGRLVNQLFTSTGRISHIVAEQMGSVLVGLEDLNDGKFLPPHYVRLGKDGRRTNVSLESLVGLPKARVRFPKRYSSIGRLADLLYVPILGALEEVACYPGQRFGLVISDESDRRAAIWDAVEGRVLRVSIPAGEVGDFEVDLHGRNAIIQVGDRGVFAFDLTNGTQLWKSEAFGEVRKVALSPDGGWVLSFDASGVIELRTIGGDLVHRFSGTEASFVLDGTAVRIDEPLMNTCSIWPLSATALLDRVEPRRAIGAVPPFVGRTPRASPDARVRGAPTTRRSGPMG